MQLRRAAYRADQFYPGDRVDCAGQLDALLAGPTPAVEGRVVAGIVPHAGWVYSGPTASTVFLAMSGGEAPGTVVIFGAVHVHGVEAAAAIWPAGAWETPLGDVAVDEDLAEAILGHGGDAVSSHPDVHRREHSIEVQVPFVRRLWPEARIVPIMVRPDGRAPEVGRAVATAVGDRADVVVLGSTDLTHYGPSYGMTDHGIGRAGLAWARDENDAAMLDLMRHMRATEIVPEAQVRHNACGPGAVAATIAYASARGASRATLLAHTTSFDVRPRGEPTDFVGYAGVVYSV